MKRLLVLCGLWLACANVDAQVWNSNIAVSRVYIPDSATYSASLFADYLQRRYPSPQEQLRTAYNWIISNIRYDKDSSYYFNWGVDYETKINATLRRRKGVCENFASLFTDISNRLNVPSYVVHGYASGSGDSRDVAHSWSAVQLNNEWYLCDPTWDAGLQNGNQYFLADPLLFAQTHVPFDPIWQLLDYPVGYNNGQKKNLSPLHFRDSIKAFLAADSLQQFLSIERRMKKAGGNKEMFRLWQSYNRMNIAIIAGENDMQHYNSAVEDINKATDIFNEFIQYRNNGFLPFRSDAAIAAMLDPVAALLKSAGAKIEQIGLLVENFQYDTEGIKKRMERLAQRRQEQLLFLKKYLAAGSTERQQMMYK
ncbi:MAG: transglutaminase domain-containing protein [Agriterribacter sp.]